MTHLFVPLFAEVLLLLHHGLIAVDLGVYFISVLRLQPGPLLESIDRGMTKIRHHDSTSPKMPVET